MSYNKKKRKHSLISCDSKVIYLQNYSLLSIHNIFNSEHVTMYKENKNEELIHMKIENCSSLEDVRHYIDKLDDQIVELIAARNAYVKKAAQFKESLEEIKGKERMEAVMDRVRTRAMELGVSPNLLTKLYTIMIDEMVEAEIAEFRNARSL